MFGTETLLLTKRLVAKLEVEELKILRFSLGVTKMDKIRNECIRGTVQLEQFGDTGKVEIVPTWEKDG